MFDTYQQARASVTQIGLLLATELIVSESAALVDSGPLRGAIRLAGVHFRYAGSPA